MNNTYKANAYDLKTNNIGIFGHAFTLIVFKITIKYLKNFKCKPLALRNLKMRKYLVFVLLLWTEFSSLSYAGKLHAISIRENDQPVSHCTLRTQHPIDDIIAFDNLDNKLYATSKDSEELKYNPCFDIVNDAITKLKSIGRTNNIFPSKVENDALVHLFVAATNLLTGEHGMPLNHSYGIELIKWYINQLYPRQLDFFETPLNKLKEDRDYSIDSFIKEIIETEKMIDHCIQSYFDKYLSMGY